MSRYVIVFNKEGYIKYTSHLDMLRLFKRAFKRADIRLKHSQGFNPHPKMTFAQPLSLGYESKCEILEFETIEPYDIDVLRSSLQAAIPSSIFISKCIELEESNKTLASSIESADYLIMLPNCSYSSENIAKACDDYLAQKSIIAKKRAKKTKKLVDVDIRNKIRSMTIVFNDDMMIIYLCVDTGSESNLSPELVIQTFLPFAGIEIPREDVEVMRTKLTIHNFQI